MTRKPRNIAASVRDRLLHLAQERGDDFQLVLTRYANERLLYRLASSAHGQQFVLKGAILFTAWTGSPHRATRDVDLLGFGDPTEARMRHVFADLLALEIGEDGVDFDADALEVGPIREDQEYGGVRVTLVARIASAKVRLQIDVGFGDVITPEATMIELPCLLELPAPRLRAYPRETVVAEKLEAMVQLGMANSRLKDFYDLDMLATTFTFDGQTLAGAIRATFERRGTPLPTEPPVALTAAFSDDASKQTQWTAFARKAGVTNAKPLPEAIATISAFASPLFAAARRADGWPASWPPGGPWAARQLP